MEKTCSKFRLKKRDKISCQKNRLETVFWQTDVLTLNDSLLKKKYPNVEFHCSAKVLSIQHFWEFWKNAPLWKAVVSKTLNLQNTMGYQWKDNIHIFHLIPSSTPYVTTGFVTGKPTKKAVSGTKIVLPRVDLFPCFKVPCPNTDSTKCALCVAASLEATCFLVLNAFFLWRFYGWCLEA